jgi:AAA family ATP:ADP antiporter
MNKRLLQLFNIRTDEAWLVNNLFWLQFFQGVGIAIFNTIAFALFLQQFDIQQLPKVYIFSALLLWAAGYVYNKIEHIIPVKKLVLGIIVFIAASILLFRLHFFAFHAVWIIFFMFSWYYVIYLLSNLEFWGVAALLFDIRQSKRLFAMIGAGDIPAKLIGYSLIPILVKFIGEENTLYVAFASMLCSLIFYFRLRNSGHLDIHVRHGHKHEQADEQLATIKTGELIKGFIGSRLIGMVAFLSFMVMLCVTIISFSFYAEVKHEAHSNEQLADFIATFYAGGRLLAIFVRMLFTGRLTHRLGTKGTMLISPIAILLFLVFIISLPFISHSELSVLYIFGTLAIITEVLKIAVQDPIFLSLMQPLSASLRLKGHTVVKGVMDPFALATSGVILLGLLRVFGRIDLFVMAYLLLAFVIIWIVAIFWVDREYLSTLMTALDKRYSVGQEINLADEQTAGILLDKIKHGDKWEVIYILRLIENHYSPANDELILQALAHAEPEVRIAAIGIAERKKIIAALPLIEGFIASKAHAAIWPEAVKAKCMLLPYELDDLDSFLEQEDPRLLQAAITGLMKSGGINAVVLSGQKLLHLLSSPLPAQRKMAADIIGELGVHSFYKPLLQLFSDSDEVVVKAAIAASGNVKNEKLIRYLIDNFLLQGKHEKLVMHALRNSGNFALPAIESTLMAADFSRRYQVKMILAIGHIGTAEAAKILDELAARLPAMQNNIFHAMHLCQFRVSAANRAAYTRLIRQQLAFATRVLFMIYELTKEQEDKALINALELEMNKIRDSLLLLFSFIFDKEQMLKAKNAFVLNKKENVANALEIIEIGLPNDIALHFIKIFEPGSASDRCMQLTAYFSETLNKERMLDDILNEASYNFHRWTKATALYSLLKATDRASYKWLEKASLDADTLLSEIGQKAMKLS